MPKNTLEQPATPPHGGLWRQDPDTGGLVLNTENVPAAPVDADKENE